MYTVQWCSIDGNLRQISFELLRDAKIEAAYLQRQHDSVQVLDKNGNPVKF